MFYDDCPQELEKLFDPKYMDYLFQMAKQNGAIKSMDFKNGFDEKETVQYALLDPEYDWTGKGEVENAFSTGFRTTHVDLSNLVRLAVEGKITSFFYGKRFFIVP